MAASKKEVVPIFTQTNLGTRLVVSVPPDVSAAHFKRELETVHFKCFPGSGEIEVHGLMVKKKSCFYYLSNSIPLKCAFHGVRGSWFIQAEARTSSECFGPCLLDLVSNDSDRILSKNGDITDPLEPESSGISIDKSSTRGEEEKYGEKELQSHKCPIEDRTIPVYVSKKKKKTKRKNPLEPESSGISIDKISTRCEEEKYGEKELQSHKCPIEDRTMPVYVSKKKKKMKRKNCILDYKDNGDEKKRVCIGTNPSALTANKISDYCLSVTEVEPRYQQASREMTDATSEMFSEVKSVTSIIKRYFPSSSEMKTCASPTSSDVTSKLHSRRRKHSKTKRDNGASRKQVDSFPKFASCQRPLNLLPCRLPTSPSHETSKGKIDRDEVGKRLVDAFGGLGISSSKKLSPAYLCRSRDGKALDLNSSALVKSIFEISDRDD